MEEDIYVFWSVYEAIENRIRMGGIPKNDIYSIFEI